MALKVVVFVFLVPTFPFVLLGVMWGLFSRAFMLGSLLVDKTFEMIIE